MNLTMMKVMILVKVVPFHFVIYVHNGSQEHMTYKIIIFTTQMNMHFHNILMCYRTISKTQRRMHSIDLLKEERSARENKDNTSKELGGLNSGPKLATESQIVSQALFLPNVSFSHQFCVRRLLRGINVILLLKCLLGRII